MPHFQVILGGKFHDNAGEYGVAIGAVPSKRIPQAVLSITDYYVGKRHKGESFQDFVGRIGKKEIKNLLEDLTTIPSHDVDRSYYSGWGDPREFTLVDMGVGECAGEVVSQAEFTLAASERELFEAHLLFDGGRAQEAAKAAYASMLRAAQGLVKAQNPAISEMKIRLSPNSPAVFMTRSSSGINTPAENSPSISSEPKNSPAKINQPMPTAPFNCCRRRSYSSTLPTIATTNSVAAWPVR